MNMYLSVIVILYIFIMLNSIEVILKDDIKDIFNHFSNLFKIRIAFFSREGKELEVGMNLPCSAFCSFLRNQLGLLPKCLETDRLKRNESAMEMKLIVYKCHAGLTEAILPVYANNTLLGFIMIGQIRSSNKIPMKNLY